MSNPLTTPQKYSINEHVQVNGWTGVSSGCIQDIQWVYHIRLGEYTWGYLIEWDVDQKNPFSMAYIPEGYLKKEANS